jgi:hypothetical protein
MPSPFPGMDPYIEDPEVWHDFYLNLAVEIRSQLNRIIQPVYVARVRTYETYEIVETGTKEIEPQKVTLRLASVEVCKPKTLELVTAIEILSPVNKQPSHDAYSEYQRKRRELLRSATHLMEIDLLRGGQRPPLEEPVPKAPYYVTLSRADRRPVVEVWPIQFQERLPILPVPLVEPDPDAPLDLSAIVVDVYERGGYATLIDYHRPPPAPKLTEADLIWVDDLLREQEIR